MNDGNAPGKFGNYELKQVFSGGSLDSAIIATLGTYMATTANWWQSILAGVAILVLRGLQVTFTDNKDKK